MNVPCYHVDGRRNVETYHIAQKLKHMLATIRAPSVRAAKILEIHTRLTGVNHVDVSWNRLIKKLIETNVAD